MIWHHNWGFRYSCIKKNSTVLQMYYSYEINVQKYSWPRMDLGILPGLGSAELDPTRPSTATRPGNPAYPSHTLTVGLRHSSFQLLKGVSVTIFVAEHRIRLKIKKSFSGVFSRIFQRQFQWRFQHHFDCPYYLFSFYYIDFPYLYILMIWYHIHTIVF